MILCYLCTEDTIKSKLSEMKKVFFVCMLMIAAVAASAQTKGLQINLWPSGAPTDNGEAEDTARVVVFLPAAEKATGRAIVVCPGGGYTHLAFEKEGTRWADVFNNMGIAVVVLKYRMPHGRWQVPQEDAKEAVRLVRRHAQQWHVNADDVGIMGFSAGGHLASTVATQAEDDARPNFQLLFYPVITMEEGVTHQGSRESLLGKSPTEELVARFSNERQVTNATPRAFIVLADDDRAVPPANAIGYYQALQQHHVPAALHIYPKGGHGFGINESFPWHAEMLMEIKAWLQSF